jgi:MoaA/NifB/PqqE/SkfB family radical SAM enzyme
MSETLHHFLNQEFQVDERIEAFKRCRLYSAEIELTDGCCLACDYCYVNSEKQPKAILQLVPAKRLIDALIDYGVTHFWWGGGEVLLNPHWRRILEYAKEKGATENLLFTNAVLLTKKTCHDICKLADRVTVHLDTVHEATFNAMQIWTTGTKPIYRAVVRGIENLLDVGFPRRMIRWNITLTRRMLPELEETLDFAIRQKKVETTVLIPIFSCGRGAGIYDKQRLSLSEMKYAFELRATVENRAFLLHLGPSEFCKQYQLTCFAVNAKGDVLPYVDCFVSGGNIYHHDIRRILEDKFEMLSFRELVSSDTYKNKMKGWCSECRDEKYCFGNPTMTLNNGGALCDSDPYCWRPTEQAEKTGGEKP